MSGDEEEGYVVRVRGLPWSATKEEIGNFFEGICLKDGLEGIHMTVSKEGRPSGEAYVELETEDDLMKALEKHKEHMGHRYIEVFKSKKSEMDWVMKRSGVNQQDSLSDGCVRLRGLPFGCSKEEISQFFSGLEIVPNGISLPTDYLGRSTGEAFVQFSSREIAEKAMGKHKEKIGHRYIEIFKSSLQEIKVAFGMAGPKIRGILPNRHCPYDRSDRFGGIGMRFNMARASRFYRGYDGYGEFGNGYGGYEDFNGYGPHMDDPYNCALNNNRFDRSFNGTNHCVRMRGLPFRATNVDICEFFRPINVIPVRIRLKNDRNGRPSGEADVFFGSHEDAVKAMTKDKANMRHRYIELFLNSAPAPEAGPKGFGGSRGNMVFNGGIGNHRIGDGSNNRYGCMGHHVDGYYCEYSGNFGNSTNTMIGGSNYSEF